MALVDYSDSDSDSDSETPRQQSKPLPQMQPQASSSSSKKPFQKLINRSGPSTSKIIVQLPTLAASDTSAETLSEPPAKRARTAGPATSRFSSIGSFLPPPKKLAAAAPSSGVTATSRSGCGSVPPPGVHLRTAAEPAFQRGEGFDLDHEEDDDGSDVRPSTGGGTGTRSKLGTGLILPAPKGKCSDPTIPVELKPEGEVKLVGKPLMFKPLSVMRRAGPRTNTKGSTVGKAVSTSASASGVDSGGIARSPTMWTGPALASTPVKKKMSLFSTDEDEPVAKTSVTQQASIGGVYEPLFNGISVPAGDDPGVDDDVTTDYETHMSPAQTMQSPSQPQENDTLASITEGIELSAAAQRELFGRRAGNAANQELAMPAGARVVNFNMEREYAANEALRASGEQVYNPVRAIAPGKHSLRQVVSMAQNNQSALEDSFAQGKNNRKDAAGRYGWK